MCWCGLMSATKIRKASASDGKEVAEVINSVIAEKNLTVLDKPITIREEEKFIASMSGREALFVAEVDGRIVGVQGIYLCFKTSAMSHVATMSTWVHKDHRVKESENYWPKKHSVLRGQKDLRKYLFL